MQSSHARPSYSLTSQVSASPRRWTRGCSRSWDCDGRKQERTGGTEETARLLYLRWLTCIGALLTSPTWRFMLSAARVIAAADTHGQILTEAARQITWKISPTFGRAPTYLGRTDAHEPCSLNSHRENVDINPVRDPANNLHLPDSCY
jgi:hypothetical protein